MDRGRIARRGLALLVAVGLAGSLLAGTASAEEAPADAAAAKVRIEWGECPKGVESPTVPLECAKVPVPLDYDDPDGTKIEIMISRVPSEKPSERRGVLMLNPGGPGGSGLTQPADLVTLGTPSTVLDSYDLIGMDPRGVGQSAPVSCGLTTDQEYQANLPPWAVDAAAVEKQAKVAKAVAEQCAANDEDGILPHISTANTARDLDFIRAALGEEKLNYFGLSYGSGLGAAYASMFPERSDRIIIDSNLGGTSLDRDALRCFGLGMEDRFPDFARYVAERHESYGLGRTPGQVRRNYLAMAEQLDDKPIAGLDGGMFRFGIFVGLYTDSQFAQTAQLWQSVTDSDEAAVRRQLEDESLLRPPGLPMVGVEPGKPGEPSPNDNAFSSFLAVSCNDSPWERDVESYQRSVAEDRKRYPLFGAASANITPCAFWADPAEEPVQISDEGPENVLVMQNLRDPATPHKGGQLTAEAFGDRARLVSIDQGGHGAYIYDENACGLNVATAFLVDGTFPKRDVFCRDSATPGLKLGGAERRQRAETLERLAR